MKKVLSVAMASAMVLGMGANAFAIQYSTNSNDTAAWPKGFQFDGSLFVTDKNGDIVEATLTDLNGKTRINFNEGDTIWMPLYAEDQRVYTVIGNEDATSTVDSAVEYLNPVEIASATGNGDVEVDTTTGAIQPFVYSDATKKVVYTYNTTYTLTAAEKENGWRVAKVTAAELVMLKDGRYHKVSKVADALADGGLTKTAVSNNIVTDDFVVNLNGTQAQNLNGSSRVTITFNGKTIADKVGVSAINVGVANVSFDVQLTAAQVEAVVKEMNAAPTYATNLNIRETANGATLTWLVPKADTTKSGTQNWVTVATDYEGTPSTVWASNVYVKTSLEKVAGTDGSLGVTVGVNDDGTVDPDAKYVDYGHYTGNIDKNWSINLIEEDNGVADLIDHAELYKADEVDYLSYKDYTDEIMPNAVYLKVELKDTWKLAKAANLKYYVYVADNKANKNVTNKVWVAGTYEASDVRTVDFTWTNDASKPAVWKVAKNESGVAVFDFADKAFFQVKMYAGESMYLDLSTAYDAAMAGDFDEADQFFSFDNENANFSRTGTLILVSDDASLVPYQVTEDGYVKVDAEYVEDFVIAHTNEKVDGFVFETKELGNYVLATDELVEEEDNKDDNTQEVVVPDDDNKETENNSKPNPSTGAEDFVGLAVSLAVVSVAAAGALALKK